MYLFFEQINFGLVLEANQLGNMSSIPVLCWPSAFLCSTEPVSILTHLHCCALFAQGQNSPTFAGLAHGQQWQQLYSIWAFWLARLFPELLKTLKKQGQHKRHLECSGHCPKFPKHLNLLDSRTKSVSQEWQHWFLKLTSHCQQPLESRLGNNLHLCLPVRLNKLESCDRMLP